MLVYGGCVLIFRAARILAGTQRRPHRHSSFIRGSSASSSEGTSMHINTRRLGLGFAGMTLAWSTGVMAADRDLRLVTAAQERNTAGVRQLLKEAVDVNTPRADGATALFWATHWDDAETVDLLLRAHANVNAADDHGVTPLDLACENGDVVL